MYNKTQQNILQFIKENPDSRVKEVIDYFHLNAAGVFRHLKKLQTAGLIYKIGKPPQVRYYTYPRPKHDSKIIHNGLNWTISGDRRLATPEQLCETRDVFQARTDRLLNDLKKILNENLVYLVVAVVGEIGNNSFDHNLGHWRDARGVFFALDVAARTVVAADRGQGIFATIKRVRPEVKDDAEAIQVAFTEMISGRAPERRGNGLKFVKKIIEENKLYLQLRSGLAMVEITGKGMNIQKSETAIPGTFAYITF